jgi:hypothetical protein
VRFRNYRSAISTSVVIDNDAPMLVHAASIMIVIAKIYPGPDGTDVNAHVIGQSWR